MKCEYCKKEFKQKNYKQKYCSAECRKNYHASKYVKRNTKRDCIICNTEYTTNGKQRTCSKECSNTLKQMRIEDKYKVREMVKKWKAKYNLTYINSKKTTDEEKKELILFLTKIYKQKYITHMQFIEEFLFFEQTFLKNTTFLHTENLKKMTRLMLELENSDFQDLIYKLKSAYENYIKYLNSINATF